MRNGNSAPAPSGDGATPSPSSTPLSSTSGSTAGRRAPSWVSRWAMAQVSSCSDTENVLKRSRSGLSFHSWLAVSHTSVNAGLFARLHLEPHTDLPDDDDDDEEVEVEEEVEEDEDHVVEGTDDDSVPERPMELDNVLEDDDDDLAKDKEEARTKDRLSSLLSALAFKSIWVTKEVSALSMAAFGFKSTLATVVVVLMVLELAVSSSISR